MIEILIVISVLLTFSTQLRKLIKRWKNSHGLIQVHETTVYKTSSRLKGEPEESMKAPEPTAGSGEPKTTTNSASVDGTKPIAVIEFDGDVYAKDRNQVARLVDEIIFNKKRIREAVVVVSSPGGGVAEYGQLFSEMERLRKAQIHLTVAIDTCAASGGYLMSVPAHKIVAAPFAWVGSIGVVAELVNVNKLLKKVGVEPMTMTAGQFKRTLTMIGEVTDEGRSHFQAQLDSIHRQFIAAVKRYRGIDADKVCNGDHWTAQESVELGLGLVDEMATSREYLLQLNRESTLVFLTEKERSFSERLSYLLSTVADRILLRLISRLQQMSSRSALTR